MEAISRINIINAIVAVAVVAANASSVSVSCKDGKPTVTVPPDAPVFALVPATAADLLPGATAVVHNGR